MNNVVILMMKIKTKYFHKILLSCICFCFMASLNAQNKTPIFKVIGFYTAKEDLAHISFVHDANNGSLKWVPYIISRMIPPATGAILMKNFFLITRWWSFLIQDQKKHHKEMHSKNTWTKA